MPALDNAITTNEMNLSLDREVIANFRGEYDRLAEILGIFQPETMIAGQTIYQTKIKGELNNSAGSGTSSGTSYVEGEEVALSKYQIEKTPVDVVDIEPYRKMTTAAAINKTGYVNACVRTDRKMISNVRAQIIKKFFDFLKNGTGTANAKTLQAVLAAVDATLGDTLETNGDETSDIVHFVNRQDAAAYLGEAPITTQTAFGMTYLQDFLGVQRVFLTNKIDSGEVWVTPVENIHIYGLDFANLASAGLSYTIEESGLIGVAHTPAYDRVSVETHVINGTLMVPEVKDYIIKGTIAPGA